MGTCPVCSSPVTEDFGLLECGSCGAQLIVHVDGRVEYSGGQEASKPAEDVPDEPLEPLEAFEGGEEQVSEAPEFQDEIPNEEPPVEEELPPELGGEVAAADMFDGSEPPDAGEAPAVYQSASKPANSPDLSDLTDFANSSDSGGREGPLRYNLVLGGIDTSDVREAFREAITDRKFMWDTEQIVRSIRNGEVRIQNVAPGKAFMLISRLRNLPLKITWEQHAVTQP